MAMDFSNFMMNSYTWVRFLLWQSFSCIWTITISSIVRWYGLYIFIVKFTIYYVFCSKLYFTNYFWIYYG